VSPERIKTLSDDVPAIAEKKKPKLGRPKKADILAKKKGHRETRGRPAGDAARIAEFKARLLGTSGEKIINTLISKALDPDDKDQAACLKMCIDRVLPLSAFDASKQSGGVPQISINITGLTGSVDNTPVIEMNDADEVQYKEIDSGT
jgi:hypothetical protein